jgi:hypothetical protein
LPQQGRLPGEASILTAKETHPALSSQGRANIVCREVTTHGQVIVNNQRKQSANLDLEAVLVYWLTIGGVTICAA